VYRLAYKSKNQEQEVELEKIMEEKKREVEVYESEILKIEKKVLTVRFVVSSGTYIRTLAQDIGDQLGYGAFAKSLRRTKIGDYKVEDATMVSDVVK
jgi:tRNA pseudouridine55 synthase